VRAGGEPEREKKREREREGKKRGEGGGSRCDVTPAVTWSAWCQCRVVAVWLAVSGRRSALAVVSESLGDSSCSKGTGPSCVNRPLSVPCLGMEREVQVGSCCSVQAQAGNCQLLLFFLHMKGT
jgi:hypothetical protein